MAKKLLVLALLSLFTVGSSFAYEGKGCRQGKLMRRHKGKVEARVKAWTKKLNLTPEQQEQVKEILNKMHESSKQVFVEAKNKIKELKKQTHNEIEALLTEGQRAKFKEIRTSCEKKEAKGYKE